MEKMVLREVVLLAFLLSLSCETGLQRKSVMTRTREENDHKTSQSPTISHTKRSCCLEITAGDINIPLDLTVEILKKLTAKSLVRFQCVSKQWSTIIGSQKDFIDSIVTRSLAQPRCDLHFIFHHCCSPEVPFFFFSSTYHHDNQHAVSIPPQCQCGGFEYQYVRGLFCCWSPLVSHYLVKIYNPTTRQSVSLAEIKSPINRRFCFFGYDHVMNQYKVMCVINGLEDQSSEHVCQVFTLGDPMKQWRNIQGIGNHSPIIKGVHINGTIYYGATDPFNNLKTYSGEVMLLSFNFSSERFDHINTPEAVSNIHRNLTLVNYKGKLGCLCYRHGAEMWVMENAEKQEWSKTIIYLPDHFPLEALRCPRFSGVTLGGEIFILQLIYDPSDPLYVCYYDPGRHSFRRTEIEGTTPRSDSMLIVGVVDHVDNTMRL